ncbi:MAG: hypothetical protein ABFD49_05065 [Armatimonadota bacterium]|nr:hypothetical protein [bacterium]
MIKRIGLVGWLFLLVMAFSLVYQLACSPLVGQNDNGDFWRILESYGLKYPAGYENDMLTWNRHYDWDGRLLRIKMFPTSELLPAGISLAASALISRGSSFDVVILGIVQSGIYLLGFVFIVLATSHWRVPQRVLFYILLLALFSDVGYVSYFNSLYTESATLIFMTLAIGLLTYMICSPKHDDVTYRRLLIWFFIATLLAATAKVGNVPSTILLVGLGFYISRFTSLASKGSLPKFRRLGMMLSAITVIILAGFWWSYKFVPGISTNNVYNMTFNEILRHSKNPISDLNDLGLDKSYMKYQGTFAWSPGIDENIRMDILKRVGNKGIIRFYAKHPTRFLDLARRGAKSVFVMRAPHLGNFESGTVDTSTVDYAQLGHDIREQVNRGSGYKYVIPSRFRSQTFDLWSNLKDRLAPKNLAFLMVFFVANLVVIVCKRLKFDKTERQRAITALHITALFGAALQFLLVLVGEAERDIIKHLFLCNLLMDVCFVLLCAYAGYLIFPDRNTRGKAA